MHRLKTADQKNHAKVDENAAAEAQENAAPEGPCLKPFHQLVNDLDLRAW
jgi:hypothetical protein